MRKIHLFFTVLLLNAFTLAATGQEKKDQVESDFGIFNNKSEYREFMGNAKKLAHGPNGSKELQSMIPLLNDIVLNRPIGWTAGAYKTQASTLGLLSNESVRQEIEMVDDQYKALQEVNRKIQSRVAEEIRGLDFSKAETVTTRIRGIRDRAKKDLEDVLLPHQVERLMELHLQSRMSRQGIVELLSEDPLKTKLEISKQQLKELRAEQKKIEAEMNLKIRQLQLESREKLISKLKPEQQKKVEFLLGEAFEFEFEEARKKSKLNNGKLDKENRK